jgi:hypothetical protein
MTAEQRSPQARSSVAPGSGLRSWVSQGNHVAASSCTLSAIRYQRVPREVRPFAAPAPSCLVMQDQGQILLISGSQVRSLHHPPFSEEGACRDGSSCALLHPARRSLRDRCGCRALLRHPQCALAIPGWRCCGRRFLGRCLWLCDDILAHRVCIVCVGDDGGRLRLVVGFALWLHDRESSRAEGARRLAPAAFGAR